MKFGTSLRNISQLPTKETRSFMLELSKAADELGFYTVWVSDHVVVPDKHNSPYPYSNDGSFVYAPDNAYWEPLTVLAGVAAVTKQVRLATGVLVLPLRHPIYGAKVMATLDCLSNGRFILGTGVGWLREEMDLLGAPTSERIGALTDEHIRIYKELWTKEYPSFEGTWFRFSGFKFEPRPVQRPIPIWVGGSSDAALRRAARLGTGWHSPPQTPEKIAEGIKKLEMYCQQEKRPFQELTLSCSSGIVFDMDAKGKGEPQALGLDKGPAPLYQGNPDQIAAVFRRYKETGIVHIGGNQRVKGSPPGLANSLKAIEIMAKHVMPQFKD